MNLNEFINKTLKPPQLNAINCDNKNVLFYCSRGLGKTFTEVCKILRDRPSNVLWVSGITPLSNSKKNVIKKIEEIKDVSKESGVYENISIDENCNNIDIDGEKINIEFTYRYIMYDIDDSKEYDLVIFDDAFFDSKIKYKQSFSTVSLNLNNRCIYGEDTSVFRMGIYEGLLYGFGDIKKLKNNYKDNKYYFKKEIDVLDEADYIGVNNIVDENNFHIELYARYNLDKNILFVTYSQNRFDSFTKSYIRTVKQLIGTSILSCYIKNDCVCVKYKDGTSLNIYYCFYNGNFDEVRGRRLNRVIYDDVKIDKKFREEIILPCGLKDDFFETYIYRDDKKSIEDYLYKKEKVVKPSYEEFNKYEWCKQQTKELMKEFESIDKGRKNTIYREEILKQISYLKDLETYYK